MTYYDDGSIGGMGTSEIVGATGDPDFEELIGAAEPGAGQPEWVQNKLRRSSAIVEQRALTSRRRFPIGFTVTTLTAGQSGVLIPAAPQNLFRGERLVIPSNIAFSINVQDLKVGNDSQFVAGSNVPGACFTEVAVGTHLLMKTAEIGNIISITVDNLDTVNETTFRGAIFGTVAR